VINLKGIFGQRDLGESFKEEGGVSQAFA